MGCHGLNLGLTHARQALTLTQCLSLQPLYLHILDEEMDGQKTWHETYRVSRSGL